MHIRQLTRDDAELYFSHRQEALRTEPLAFLASPEDDIASSTDAMRERLGGSHESVIFGAFDRTLIGSIGVYREKKSKADHNAYIWGLYVEKEYRRKGAARTLLQAAIDHARRQPGVIQIHLGVSEAAPAARELYLSMGFRVWGTEPRYLRFEGTFVASDHMVLTLDAAVRERAEEQR